MNDSSGETVGMLPDKFYPFIQIPTYLVSTLTVIQLDKSFLFSINLGKKKCNAETVHDPYGLDTAWQFRWGSYNACRTRLKSESADAGSIDLVDPLTSP